MTTPLFHALVAACDLTIGASTNWLDAARTFGLGEADRIDSSVLKLLSNATYFQVSPCSVFDLHGDYIQVIVTVRRSSMWTIYAGFPDSPPMALADFVHGTEDDENYQIGDLKKKQDACMTAVAGLAAEKPLFFVQHYEERAIIARTPGGIVNEIGTGDDAGVGEMTKDEPERQHSVS